MSSISLETKPNSTRNIRVVSKIKACIGSDLNTKLSWISIQRDEEDEPCQTVKISFHGDQLNSNRETYELDYCYEAHEKNSVVYEREVKPIVYGVFEGRKGSVIAYGAKGSGKTFTIQGGDGNPGLVVLAMEEILEKAAKDGRLVSISRYEVCEDNIYDCLTQERTLVSILEDAQGRLVLKGLSKASVKSMEEFRNLYFRKKNSVELPQRSHKGLMVHIVSCDDSSITRILGKMHFVDMAGYEDGRKKGINVSSLSENAKTNKALYAIHNVVYALSNKEAHVPYRESKLTRLLQDSLGGENKILIVACLNSFFCQDTIYMAKLASRSCQRTKRILEIPKRMESTPKRMVSSSSKALKSSTFANSTRKRTDSRLPLSEKKSNVSVEALAGRKLFDAANQTTSLDKVTNLNSQAIILKEEEEIISVLPPATKEEEHVSDGPSLTRSSVEDISLIAASKDVDCNSVAEQGTLVSTNEGCSQTGCDNSTDIDLLTIEGKENQSSNADKASSPPLSLRLQKLTNYLKSLESPALVKPIEVSTSSLTESRTPTHEQNLRVIVKPIEVFTSSLTEPRTPTHEQDLRVNQVVDGCVSTPLTTLNVKSVAVKDSLTRECLKFLNSASKDELKELKGIGEKRAAYILECREESPEYFKNLEDLKDVGLSTKQIKKLMKNVAEGIFE